MFDRVFAARVHSLVSFRKVFSIWFRPVWDLPCETWDVIAHVMTTGHGGG
jgi:hypothetical protein